MDALKFLVFQVMQRQDQTVGINRLALPELVAFNSDIPEKADDAFRVVTWNVHQWCEADRLGKRNTFDELSRIVRVLDPDVLGLQEVSGRSIGDKQRVSCDADEELRNELLIHTRVVVVDSLSVDIGHNRCMSLAVLSVGNSLLVTAVLHLDVHDGRNRLENIACALYSLEATCEAYHTNNAILMGDFNSYRKRDYPQPMYEQLVELKARRYQGLNIFEAIDYLESRGWQDTFAGVTPIPANTTFFGGRIDFVFTHPGFDFAKFPLRGAYVYFTGASDHLPVVVDFGFPQ